MFSVSSSFIFFFSSRRRHTRCALVTGVQTCALPISIIAGHSERRTDQHESHEDVAAKASAAHGQGLNVILCVGETEAQRDAGDAERVVADQLLASLPENAAAAWLSIRSEEHTSELQSLMRISYAVFCLKKKKIQQ